MLRALHDHSCLNASELSERTLISMPSLSRIIRILARRDLVIRSSHRDDQRSILLTLSSEGRQLLSVAVAGPESEQIYQQLAEKFGAEKLRHLYTLIDELTTCLAENKFRDVEE